MREVKAAPQPGGISNGVKDNGGQGLRSSKGRTGSRRQEAGEQEKRPLDFSSSSSPSPSPSPSPSSSSSSSWMSRSVEESLLWAAHRGNLEVVQSLCSDPAVNVNWQYEGGYTPFFLACQENRTEVVQYLLSLSRVDPVLPMSRGATPFAVACQKGHPEVVSLLLASSRIDPCRPMSGGASPFFVACHADRKEVVSLLLADPRIDPNKASNDRKTPFYIACEFGHKEVVSRLLASPRVDPEMEMYGMAPFMVACTNGREEVVAVLLADPRIEADKTDIDLCTPLFRASQSGQLGVVERLLASGRKIRDTWECGFHGVTAAEQGRRQTSIPKSTRETEENYQRRITNGPLCGDLIEEYGRAPVAVRHRLRRQPGLRDYFAGQLFALLVFHSDNFVTMPEQTTTHTHTKRFFEICTRLPLEVQMILCNRMFGSPRDIILTKDSEPGFQVLARSTTWQ